MTTAATRMYLRHVGDESAEVLSERDRKAAARQAELDARIAARRESNPELADWAERRVGRRR